MVFTPDSSPMAVYYHTHWDREWYLPFRAYQVRLSEVVDEILERLESGALPCFMLDGQTVVLNDYLELRPQNAARMRALIEAGKLKIGPWFVMPDEFLVGGESLLRNLTMGIRESSAWGCDSFTGYLPDTFGHSDAMPLLFANCGIESAVVWRGINPDKSLFRWRSADGSSVKTLHLTDGYFQMMLDDWTQAPNARVEALQTLFAKLRAAAVNGIAPLLPIGGDHLGVVPETGRQALLDVIPDIWETTPDAYLAQLPANLELPLVSGELMDNSGSFLLPGVYSARLYLKQMNRLLEQTIVRQLEPLLAMQQLYAAARPYPESALALTWKTLILNHPHDSICGCSIDAVHRENEVRYEAVAQLTEALGDRAETDLLRTFGVDNHWLVWNTGDLPVSGVVPVIRDALLSENFPTDEANVGFQLEMAETVLQDAYRADTHRIPQAHLTKEREMGWIWADAVPGHGLRAIPFGEGLPADVRPVTIIRASLASGADTADMPVTSPLRMSNGLLTVAVDGRGIVRIEDLRTGKSYPDLLQFQDMEERGDSYNSAPVPGSLPMDATYEGYILENGGPLIAQILLHHRIPDTTEMLVTRVTLEAGSVLVQFEIDWVNHSGEHKLQATFATGAPISRVVAESHFGTVKRGYLPDYREADHMPAAAWKELRTNTGPVQRFFSANGQSWITEGLTEYEVEGERMKITLLRTFDVLSSADTGVRGAQAGPPLHTPDGECLNRGLTASFGWLPTPDTTAELYAAADRFFGCVWGLALCPERQYDAPGTQGGSAWPAMEKPARLLGLVGRGNGTSAPWPPNPLPPAAVGKPSVTPASKGLSLIAWDNMSVVSTACFWQPGKGLVLRVLNTTHENQTIALKPGLPCASVQRVNFLEEWVQSETLDAIVLAPHAVVTLLLAIGLQ